MQALKIKKPLKNKEIFVIFSVIFKKTCYNEKQPFKKEVFLWNLA